MTKWIALAVFVFASHAFAAEKLATLRVETMACGPDPHNIRNSLTALPGVSKVDISLDKKSVTVTFADDKVTVDQLISATAGAGYPALPVN
jgi:periplasmic mercuric ion binding protein